MFLEDKIVQPLGVIAKTPRGGNTHCKVGTMPLLPVVAPGVAAGVAGVPGITPLPCMGYPPAMSPAPCAPCTSFTEDGGVRSAVPAPPGKDSDDGDVKARAC